MMVASTIVPFFRSRFTTYANSISWNLLRLRALPLTDAEKIAILGGNAQQLLGLT